MKIIAYIIIAGLLALIAAFIPLGSGGQAVILGVISGILLLLIDAAFSARIAFSILIKSYTLLYNRWVRISMSCLLRIKVDDRYLLVRGRRITRQFQPVGGVLKYYPQAVDFMSSIEAMRDHLVPEDRSSKWDLRLRLKGRYLARFLRWFDSQKDRELWPWRDFYEDLVSTGILSIEIFPYIHCRRLRCHYWGINYVDYAQCHQLIVAEIYELVPDEEQLAALRELTKVDSDFYVWVTSDIIQQRGVVPGKSFEGLISPTSEWIL